MKGPSRSLTVKLILLYLGISLVGVALMAGAIRIAFRDSFRDNIRPHLDLYVEYLLADLGSPPDRERALAITRKIPLRIIYRGDKEQWSTHGDPIPELDDIQFWKRKRLDQGSLRFGHGDNQNVAVLRADGYTVYFLSPGRERLEGTVTLLPLSVIVGVLFLLYWVTRRLFAPLHQIRSAMTDFGAGELDRRLSLKRRDELGDMADSFSKMAQRIQGMLESKRQLLLAISHELRSPLTRARVATAMLEDPAQRDEIDAELAEMEALIAELLETERLNAEHGGGHQALNLETLDLADLVRSVVAVTSDQVGVDCVDNNTQIQGDATRLRLVLKNLLENAIKHTPEGNEAPEISLRKEGETLVLALKDHGTGIPAEHLPHLCEPFYRVDPARQRATGGYGLGLYLCRVIVEAHGGRLEIESQEGEGTLIRIRL